MSAMGVVKRMKENLAGDKPSKEGFQRLLKRVKDVERRVAKPEKRVL